MKIFYSILFLILLNTGLSRGISPIVDMKVESTPVLNNIDSTGVPTINDSTVYSCKMFITISDTLSPHYLITSLKDNLDSLNPEFSRIFAFDDYGPFSDGCNYSRNGFSIILDLGLHEHLLFPRGELKIEFFNGTYSEPILFY